MLAHFIYHKGKGRYVLGIPLIVSVILFVFFDAMALDDKYIASITLLLSAIIVYLIDDKRPVFYEGDINQQRVKGPRGNNSLMFINMRYWAYILALGGIIAMFNIK